jgi:hypothetical protein
MQGKKNAKKQLVTAADAEMEEVKLEQPAHP